MAAVKQVHAEQIASIRFGDTLLSAGVLAFLIFYFGRYVQIGSFDLVQHFLLVDEIMKHGTVRPPPIPSLGAMAYYPPVAHWMAAIVGWIGGSGLVGITIITVASVFLNYLLIAHLVGASSPARVLLYAVAFYALRFTISQIGWEVVENFFYPQLVADIVYFAILLWASRSTGDWKQALVFVLAGAATMWIQPLIAVHILAVGIVLMAFRFIEIKKTTGSFDPRSVILVAAIVVLALAIVMLHPAFKTMRTIAANDGSLGLGYDHVTPVALVCAAFGLFSLWRRLAGRAEFVDAVLGSAVLAAVGLELIQVLLLKFHGDGSAYAVKKHMFLVLTLGIMNAVRIIASYLPEAARVESLPARIVAPIMAGLASVVILQGYTTPLAPIVSAMSYANHAATYQLPGFVPGNTVDDDTSQPLFAKIMISLTAFKHPLNKDVVAWNVGGNLLKGATYAMVLRTPDIDKQCQQRYAESETYVIVEPDCLKVSALNKPISFAIGGDGFQFATKGWSVPEPWGTWTTGDGAEVTLSVPPTSKGPYKLVVDGTAYVTPEHPKQVVEVSIGGTSIAKWVFSVDAPVGERTAIIPAELVKNGTLRIDFKSPGAASPSQVVKGSLDARMLGLGVKTITLHDSSTAE